MPPKTSPHRQYVSLSFIIIVSTIAVVAATVVSVAGVYEHRTRASLRVELQGGLLREARNLASVSSDAILTDYPELTLCPIVVLQEEGRRDLSFTVVLDAENQVIGHGDVRLVGTRWHAPDSFGEETAHRELRPGEWIRTTLAQHTVSVPIEIDGATVGHVMLGLRASYLDALVKSSRRELVIIGALVLGLAVVVTLSAGLILVRRPITVLRRGLERIGQGVLDEPISLGSRTELGLLADTVNSMATHLRQARQLAEERADEIIETQKEVIVRLGEIVESRSKETGNHIVRVGRCAQHLARLVGLPEEETDLILLASPMHDVGKIAIADSILNKPGKLTPAEYEIIKSHTTIGFNLLKGSHRAIMKSAAIIAYEHHERWDGSGYPRGIKGTDIHVYGRIVALVDVFDALLARRVYKEPMPLEKALDVLRDGRGKHFDPELIDAFFAHVDEFVAIQDEYADEFPELDAAA